MGVKQIIRAEKFKTIYQKIDNSIRQQLNKAILKIIANPEIGKPMRFVRKGTREVYVGSFRLSYSYDSKSEILYLLDFYHKDEQ